MGVAVQPSWGPKQSKAKAGILLGQGISSVLFDSSLIPHEHVAVAVPTGMPIAEHPGPLTAHCGTPKVQVGEPPVQATPPPEQ